MKSKAVKSISAEEFDALFDSGSDEIDKYLDWENAAWRVNVDFPSWSIKALDKEANRLGIARQALIKLWIIEKLDSLPKARRKKR